MENQIDIEDFDTHDMNEETHGDECYTKSTNGSVGNIPLVGIFMICDCKRKLRKAYKFWKENGSVPLGESLDLHLPGYHCSYQWRPSTRGQMCIRRCNCRHTKLSANI